MVNSRGMGGMLGSVEVIVGGIQENGEVVGSAQLELLKSMLGFGGVRRAEIWKTRLR